MAKKVKQEKKPKRIESEDVAASLVAVFTEADVREMLARLRGEIQASADEIKLDSQSQIVARASRAHAATMVDYFTRTAFVRIVDKPEPAA